MSESKKIADLINRLNQIDKPKQLNESVNEAVPLIPAAMAAGRMAAPYIARGAASLAGKAKNLFGKKPPAATPSRVEPTLTPAVKPRVSIDQAQKMGS